MMIERLSPFQKLIPRKIEGFRTVNMPTNEKIKAFKMAKELGVEIPKDIENYFKEYGIEV